MNIQKAQIIAVVAELESSIKIEKDQDFIIEELCKEKAKMRDEIAKLKSEILSHKNDKAKMRLQILRLKNDVTLLDNEVNHVNSRNHDFSDRLTDINMALHNRNLGLFEAIETIKDLSKI